MTISTDGWYPFVDPVEMNFAQVCMNCAILGYVLFQASNLISDGSELLMLVPKLSTIVGSIVLPVLGAVPDGMMVLFSGIGAHPQKEVAVGIGTLAGSTIMLLTLPWFIAVFSGRVNLKDGAPTYKRPVSAGDDWQKLSPQPDFGLWTTGVSVSQEIRENAKIMLMSLFGYLVIQIPALIVSKPWEQKAPDAVKEASFERIFSLIGFFVCCVELGYYLKIQLSTDDTSKLEDMIAETHVKSIKQGTMTLRGAMLRFREERIGGLLTDNGGLREDLLVDKEHLSKVRWLCKILAPFFAYYDLNGDNQIDFNEFRLLWKDIRGRASKQQQRELFDSADTQHNGSICFEEFAACIMAYAMDPMPDVKDTEFSTAPSMRRRSSFTGTAGKETSMRISSCDKAAPRVVVSDEEDEEDDKGDDDDDDDEEEEEDMPEDLVDMDPDEQQRRILLRAFGKMGLGSVILLVFSDPMVDVMSEMGDRLGISAFYVSFVLAPMASNASEMIAAYNYASKRTVKSMSTALSTLEGAAVMNNTFVLAVFMGLIFFQGLAWEFTAETISILSIQIMLGFSVMYRRTQSFMDGFVVLTFYPIALSIVAVLEEVLHID